MLINEIDIDTIMLSLAGSHLYGTSTPDSDIDIRGVCFSPINNLLGLDGFEQYDFHSETHIKFDGVYVVSGITPKPIDGLSSSDITIYSLQKFAKLCLDANPNIIELLFSMNGHSLLEYSMDWNDILRNKKLFLSQRSRHTFSGYAFSQLNRIKVYTKWRDDPPQKPDGREHGLTQTDEGGYLWTNSNLKNAYDNKLKEFQHYTEWLTNRNPKRRELEEKYGYDTKHASHLVRLILEGIELLTTGEIKLPLKDEYLKVIMDVRNGLWEYDKLIKESERGFEWLKNAHSSLPNKPDRKKVNELIINMELKRIGDNLCL